MYEKYNLIKTNQTKFIEAYLFVGLFGWIYRY